MQEGVPGGSPLGTQPLKQPTSVCRGVDQKRSPVTQLYRAPIIWEAQGEANTCNSSIPGYQQGHP